MGDRYASARWPEHSTLGESGDRFRRDPDAFAAGAQYALDRLVGSIDQASRDFSGIAQQFAEYLNGRAADILTNVHDREL